MNQYQTTRKIKKHCFKILTEKWLCIILGLPVKIAVFPSKLLQFLICYECSNNNKK